MHRPNLTEIVARIVRIHCHPDVPNNWIVLRVCAEMGFDLPEDVDKAPPFSTIERLIRRVRSTYNHSSEETKQEKKPKE